MTDTNADHEAADTDEPANQYADDVQPKDQREAEARREQNAHAAGSESIAQSSAEPADHTADDAEDQRADPDEFFVTRDEEGNLQSIKHEIPMYGEVEYIQMSYGKAEDMFGDVGQIAQVGPEGIARALREHLEYPDLNQYARREFPHASRGQKQAFNAHVVRNEMTPFAPMVLLEGLLEVSGLKADVSVDEQGNATIDFGEGNQ